MPKQNIVFPVQDLVNFIPGHVYWLNRDGVYLGCNDQQAKSAGLASSNDVVGLRNKDFTWLANADILDATNELVMSTGKTIVLAEDGPLFDGTEATFISTKSPLFDAAGEVVGLIGNSIDITKRKSPEDSLLHFERVLNQICKQDMWRCSSFVVPESINQQLVNDSIFSAGIDKKVCCHKSLTLREKECAYCLIKGATAKEIAKLLNISVRTVDSHIEHMKSKLLCCSKSQLVQKLFSCSNMLFSE